MDPDDPRVKDLQQLAWSLQSLTNKPGARLPEDFKRECYKLSSKVNSLCTDAAYTEEEDFVERSKAFWKLLEDKKKECADVEEAEKKKITGKCYRQNASGGYEVADVTDRSCSSRATADIDAVHSLKSTVGGARSLTVKEVVARCRDDPEVLSLCDMGLGDSDAEILCQALKQGGADITSLDISHNFLADVGVQRLVSALASGTCPKLKELHIGFNSFGELGTQILTGGLAALRRNLVVCLDDNVKQGGSVESSGEASTDTLEHAEPRCQRAQDWQAKVLRAIPVQDDSGREVCSRPLHGAGKELADVLERRLDASESSPSKRTSSVAPLSHESASELASGDSLEPCTDNAAIAATASTASVAVPASIDADRCPTAADTGKVDGQPTVAAQLSETHTRRGALAVDLLKAGSSSGCEVRATLSLPEDVMAAGDLDVDVSSWRVVIRRVSGSLVADAALPCAVVADTAQAVFSRKRRTMTITLHPADPAAVVAAPGA
jgi:hypothetical protein